MDFLQYTFRAHQLGKIISASGKLTDGNKTYLKELFTGAITGTRKEVSSKYFEKGLFEEESGISLLNNTIYKGKLLTKNKERKNNGWVQGECDVIKDSIVYDIKNAWDVFTFENSALTHEYTWQLKCYMWLWEVTNARLFYCLNNTPEHLLIAEERKLFYAGNYISMENEEYLSDCEMLRKKHNHDSKPLEERFKIWDVNLTAEDIVTIQVAITKAREYLCDLQLDRASRLEYNRNFLK